MSAIFEPHCPTTAELRTQTIGSACCCWFFFLQFAWTHESSSSGLFLVCRSRGKHTHAIVCRTLKLSVSQWRQWSQEVQSDISFLSVGQIEASKFDSPAPRLFFFYWLNSYCHVAMMKKHSMNPFILWISPNKSLCTYLTDRRAFTWSSCQQDLFCGEPVNFVDASLVNKCSRPPKRVGESSRGLSADEPVGTWETPFVFSTMKGSQ